MLHLKDYRVIYPNTPALHYREIHVRKGETVGLFGPSGCGKTSLLESLFSVEFAGRTEYSLALLDGKPIPGPGAELYRTVSYCPQFSQAALNPKMTIQEHLHVMLEGNGIKEDLDEIREMLWRLKLDEALLKRRPGGLSGGQQQRMVLLLCAMKRPRLMVLDEPSSAIDLITQKDIVTFLEGFKGRCSVLMVAHSRPLLERLCETMIEL